MNKVLDIRRLIHSRSINNSIWIIGEQVFQMVISLVVGILTARFLGPSNYGTLNYTFSFVSFVSSIATLGMETVVIKKIIEHPNEEGLYLGSCIGFRIFSSVICSIVIAIMVFYLNGHDTTKLLLVSLQSLKLLFDSVHILDSWFQRHLKSKYVSIGKMIACVIVSLYKVFLLATSKSVAWFAFSNSFSDLIIGVVMLFFYFKDQGQLLKFSLKKGFEVLHESYHFIISGLMVSVYGQMDRMMIGQMMTDTDVGLYTTASTLCSMWIFVPIAIMNSFRPIILEKKHNGDEKQYLKTLMMLYSAIIWMSIFASVCICAISQPLISVLYGELYLGSVTPLRIIIWCETFSMIGTARSIWLLCEDKNMYAKYLLAIGAFVNVVLNAIFIPNIGINGAAFATLITQITTSMVAPLFFKETRIHTKIVIDSFLLKWREL